MDFLKRVRKKHCSILSERSRVLSNLVDDKRDVLFGCESECPPLGVKNCHMFLFETLLDFSHPSFFA